MNFAKTLVLTCAALGLSVAAHAQDIVVNGSITVLPVMQKAAESFMAANPDIKVEIIDVPSADYTTKLSVMLNGGSDEFRNTITDDGLRAIARDFKLDINESFLD